MGIGRGVSVLLAGDASVLADAGAVLAAEGVRVLRWPQRSGFVIPRRVRLVLLAEGAELLHHWLQVRASAGVQQRRLRVTVVRRRVAEDLVIADAGVRERIDREALDAGLRLEWLDPDRTAARVLLGRWPLHRAMDPPYEQRPHVLIAGFGAFARAFFLATLRVGQYGERPPLVTVAAEHPEQWRDWIDAAHPQAAFCAELRFTGLPTPSLAGVCPLTTVAVCDQAPEAGLALARRLIGQAAAEGASPLVLLVVDGAWPTVWLRGRLSDWDGQLVPVQRQRLAFSREVLLEGRDDALAEVVHEHYRDTSAAQGREPAAEPSGRPWGSLATSYKDANRHQADHLWAKLAVTDCRAAPVELVESFAFAPSEVERLAMIEHRRWAVERWLDGWRYGPARDNTRKLHPQLIPYADLSDAMQDLDRFAVRLVPALLARSGLAVLRRLIVGLRGGDAELAQQGLRETSRGVLRRLLARYPDRGLTLVLDITDGVARGVARDAANRFGVGLFLLLPGPLPGLLSAQSEPARQAMLTLLAVAERRIQLADAAAVRTWLARRAEVLFSLQEPSAASLAQLPRKAVHLDAGGRAHWGFEY